MKKKSLKPASKRVKISRPATQRDLRLLGSSLRSEIGVLRSEFGVLRTEFGDLRTEFGDLRTEFGDLRTEFGDLRTEFGDLRTEFGVLRSDMKTFKSDVSEMIQGFASQIIKHVDKTAVENRRHFDFMCEQTRVDAFDVHKEEIANLERRLIVLEAA